LVLHPVGFALPQRRAQPGQQLVPAAPELLGRQLRVGRLLPGGRSGTISAEQAAEQTHDATVAVRTWPRPAFRRTAHQFSGGSTNAFAASPASAMARRIQDREAPASPHAGEAIARSA